MDSARQSVVEYRDANRGFELYDIQNQLGEAGVALVEFRESMADIGVAAEAEGCTGPQHLEEFLGVLADIETEFEADFITLQAAEIMNPFAE